MANLKERRSENIQGNFFVDKTCIDCGTCYWMAPETFREIKSQSAVYQQPTSELAAAYRALYSCPTNSIGVINKDPIYKEVLANFPYELENGIYHCGFHAENSFGAASYFIKNDKGNFLIDSPRYVNTLADHMQELGGVAFQLLTHKDDIADTNLYWAKFHSQRMIHREDSNAKTVDYERFFEGESPAHLTEDMIMIPVPGHTKGSVCYLYQNKYLFTGDHLAFSPELHHLYAFKNACWFDFGRQIESMEKLLNYEFDYVLPGHDFPLKSLSRVEMKKSLEVCIEWMKNG